MLFQHHVTILRLLSRMDGKITGREMRKRFGYESINYASLHHLEDMGLVDSDLAYVDLLGHPVRNYWITDAGLQALRDLGSRMYPPPTVADAVFMVASMPVCLTAGALCGVAIVHHEWLKAGVCGAVIVVLGIWQAILRRRFQ